MASVWRYAEVENLCDRLAFERYKVTPEGERFQEYEGGLCQHDPLAATVLWLRPRTLPNGNPNWCGRFSCDGLAPWHWGMFVHNFATDRRSYLDCADATNALGLAARRAFQRTDLSDR